jgi:hypothetical protein
MLEDRQMTTYRIKFTIDQDAQFEESNGEARPLTETEYADAEYNREDGSVVPYAEYLTYYGNPDRHVYLGVIVERQCECCHAWAVASSLWDIDFMDDSPELASITLDAWMDEATARALPGYAGDIVGEQLGDL